MTWTSALVPLIWVCDALASSGFDVDIISRPNPILKVHRPSPADSSDVFKTANRVSASLNILKGGRVSRAGTTPTAVEVVTIWNSVFPDHAVSVEEREDRDLVLVITKLDKIDGWRNRIGAAGVTVWKTVFKGKSKQEVIADVEWYLSGSDRSRVFYYCDVIDDEETGKTKLMIKQGLNYHRTGQLVIPEGSLGQFSKTNWADHMDFSEGVQKVVASTSAITAVVKKLKESQWDKIITAAAPLLRNALIYPRPRLSTSMLIPRSRTSSSSTTIPIFRCVSRLVIGFLF
ncbi:hypothetical protein B0H10DRAFT_2239759 [Mycena sp. CBHHK59/15]|nr:hypothetical protein B0H10DRAFT_2239759 [Mycena sp. CBHHK59/15]